MQKTREEILDDFARGRDCAEQVCMMLAGRLGDDADTLRRSAMVEPIGPEHGNGEIAASFPGLASVSVNDEAS